MPHEDTFRPRPGFGYVRTLSQHEELPLLRDHLLRLDGEKVRVLLRSLVPAASVDHVFICGPTGMSEDIETTCRDIGIAEERIHVERFVRESVSFAIQLAVNVVDAERVEPF